MTVAVEGGGPALLSGAPGGSQLDALRSHDGPPKGVCRHLDPADPWVEQTVTVEIKDPGTFIKVEGSAEFREIWDRFASNMVARENATLFTLR